MTQYENKLITYEEAQSAVHIGLVKWKETTGTIECLYALGFNARTRGLFVAHFKDAFSDFYKEIPIKIPRFGMGVGGDEIAHHFKHAGVTLVYTTRSMKGEVVPKHFSEWTAVDGTETRQIVYVQNGDAKEIDMKKGCLDFNSLPDHLTKRKYVSVVMRGADICMDTDSHYRQIMGEYEETEIKGVRTRLVRVPKWECDLKMKKCKGPVPEQFKEKLKIFLA